MERFENRQHRTQSDHLAGAAAADDHLPHAATAEAARSGAQLLPRADYPPCMRLMATILARLINAIARRACDFSSEKPMIPPPAEGPGMAAGTTRPSGLPAANRGEREMLRRTLLTGA